MWVHKRKIAKKVFNRLGIKNMGQKSGIYLFFLAPAVLALLIVMIYPLFFGFRISFFEWNLTKRVPPEFIGFQNYTNILQDPTFFIAVKNTVLFMGGVVSIQFLIGFGFALLFDRNLRGTNIVKMAILLPMMITPVVAGLIWTLMYDPDFGFIAYCLNLINLRSPMWLSDPNIALISAMIVNIWQWTPLVTLILLAGLKAIPQEAYEVAEISGASGIQTLRYVTLGYVRPVILVVILLRVMDTLKVFDIIYVLTGGGPGLSTEVVSLLTYREAFGFFKVGKGAALSTLLLIITMGIGLVLIRFMYRKAEV